MQRSIVARGLEGVELESVWILSESSSLLSAKGSL